MIPNYTRGGTNMAVDYRVKRFLLDHIGEISDTLHKNQCSEMRDVILYAAILKSLIEMLEVNTTSKDGEPLYVCSVNGNPIEISECSHCESQACQIKAGYVAGPQLLEDYLKQ